MHADNFSCLAVTLSCSAGTAEASDRTEGYSSARTTTGSRTITALLGSVVPGSNDACDVDLTTTVVAPTERSPRDRGPQPERADRLLLRVPDGVD